MMREGVAVIGDQHEVKLYANRTKAFLGGAGCAGFGLAIALVYPLPTPEATANPWMYQEPFKTLLFIAIAACCLVGTLVSMYWTATSSPKLLLNATELVYQPFPFVTRRIRWVDVSSIHPVTTSTRVHGVRVTTLTLFIQVRPEAVAAYGYQAVVKLKIVQGLLPVPVREVIPLLGHYCQMAA